MAEAHLLHGPPLAGKDIVPNIRKSWFVDPEHASAGSVGTNPAEPFSTLAAALTACNTGDRIYIHGDCNEPSLICSNLKFDVQIIGCGSLHHPDAPSASYHPGASMIRDTTDAGVNVTVRGRGWQFHNICFDSPASYASVQLSRNALTGTSEYDGSHASFVGCRFLSGKYGIDDAGGANNVTVDGCEFAGMTTCGIYGSSTSVANPRAWKIKDCIFPAERSSLGNAEHIDLSLNESVISGSFFGTVLSTGHYIDLTGGYSNMVTRNLLMGVYATGDYVSGTGDSWIGNDCTPAITTAPNGRTIAVPAA